MIDLYEVADILYDISNNGSTIYKAHMLTQNTKVEGLREVLKFIYDPYFTTGIKLKKLEKGYTADLDEELSVEAFMRYLREHPTGSDHDVSVANAFIEQYDYPASWIAAAIATKSLQIGVSVTTLNNVFGEGFIPKIGIMRGSPCPESIHDNYIVTEKIDGNRRLIFVRDGRVDIYTRSGKPDTGLVEIAEQAALLPRGYMYDAECVASGIFENNIEQRQASTSILSSGGQRSGVDALIFDMVPIEQYDAGRSKYGAAARKAILASTFKDYQSVDKIVAHGLLSADTANSMIDSFAMETLPTNIKALPILGIVTNREEADAIANTIWQRNGEGAMLVAAGSAYEVNPNPRKTLLKVKRVQEYRCRCIGIYAGNNSLVGTLGGIYLDYKGNTVGCGSGFTLYDRQKYWDASHLIVGQMIEIESGGESRNKQGRLSLSHPIFKRIVGDD